LERSTDYKVLDLLESKGGLQLSLGGGGSSLIEGDDRVTVRSLSSSRRLAVCLISRHPGLLTSLEHLLSGGRFKVTTLCVGRDQDFLPLPGHGKQRESEQLPQASVFVIDGNSLNIGTEALIERIRVQYPGARLLIIKETTKDERVFPRLRLGVRGIVPYADVGKDLANAIEAVSGGDYWVQRKQLVRFVDWLLARPSYRGTLSEPGPLSRREREVLVSVLAGLTNKEIASSLNISERTVKFHVSHLLQKLGAHRRSDLIAKQYQVWPALS
jgi:DNA-binding NarL/FixJ family response regulator